MKPIKQILVLAVTVMLSGPLCAQNIAEIANTSICLMGFIVFLLLIF